MTPHHSPPLPHLRSEFLHLSVAPVTDDRLLGWCDFTDPRTGLAWLRPALSSDWSWYDPEAPPVTWGPSYKEADGRWAHLAGCPADLVESEFATAPGELFTEYRIGGGPILRERYVLRENELDYATSLAWLVGGFRFCLPLAHELVAASNLRIAGPLLEMKHAQGSLSVESLVEGLNWERQSWPLGIGTQVFHLFYLQGRSVLEHRLRFSVAR